MAFSAVTALGTAGVETGAGNPSITLGANAEAGRLVFVLIAKDNVGTTANATQEITGVTDSAGGNKWMSAHRWRSALAANAGAYVDVWYSVLTNQINSGGTITVTKSTDVDCAITAYKATIGANNLVTVVGLNQENSAADPGSIATSGLASVEHLHVRAIAAESETATGPTATASWTAIAGTISTTAGGAAANMRVAGEYRITTSTGETSNPTLFAADQANVLVAFAEITASPGECLVAHCNGTDGSTTFTDSSTKGHTITAVNSAQIDTAQSKFGGASALLNNGHLNLDGSSDFTLIGDFTIDFWFRVTNATTLQYLYTNGGDDIFVFVQSTQKLTFYANGSDRITGTTNVTTNAWHHCAITRSGSTTRLFLDGTQEGSDYTDNVVHMVPASLPRIGAHSTGTGNAFDRWIDEIHVNNGEALWTANFTPPTVEYGATQDLTPSLVTNTNSFFSPTTAYFLTPSLHTNTNSYFTHDLEQTIPAQDLTQDTTFANTNSYFTHAITVGSVDLAPSLFTNTQSFFTATLTLDLTPALYTNSQTYFTHTIVAIGGDQELFPSLFVEENIFELGSPDWFWEHFIQSGDDAILLPALFANTNTFFTHLVSLPDLFASLYTNTNTFFSPTIAYVIQPPLHTNSNSFFTHSLSVGAVDLAPSLFTNTNSFFTHVISAGDATLTPSLFTNTNTFFGHTLETSTVNLAPPLHTNTNSFFGPTISLSLTPSLFTNTNTFFGPTITLSLTPALFTNTNTFFSATVSLALAPSLFTNTNTFFAHTVSAGTVDLAPTLFTNTNTFFTHVVFRETQFIEPSLYTDPDTFFGGAVEQEGAPGAGTALNNQFIMSVGAMSVR